MTPIEYNNLLVTCSINTNKLPATDVKYYLTLLINALQNSQNERTEEFVTELKKFIDAMHLVLLPKSSNDPSSIQSQFDNLARHYDRLTRIAKTHHFPARIINALLQLGSVISGFVCAVIGGLSGSITGLIRGLKNHRNPFKAAGIGFAVGIVYGSAIGFRTPKKLFKHPVTRQLKYSLDWLQRCTNRLKNTYADELNAMKISVKKDVLAHYYDGNETEFNQFINNPNIPYQINAVKATFVCPTLENYLGHHGLITIPLNSENKIPLALELNSAPLSCAVSMNEEPASDLSNINLGSYECAYILANDKLYYADNRIKRVMVLGINNEQLAKYKQSITSTATLQKLSKDEIRFIIALTGHEPTSTNCSRRFSQTENRTVSGEKIIEMIALHRILVNTYEKSPKRDAIKPGECDCFSHLDKIITGTSQTATLVKRFDRSENWIGRNLGFFIEQLSPFARDTLNNPPKASQPVP